MLKFTIIITVAIFLGLIIYNALPEEALPTDKKITKIIVEKSKRQLKVFSDTMLLKTYEISLGSNPLGHKQYEGDGKTPEGKYIINDKNPNSGYYLNLGISYPNSQDIKYANSINKSPGGDIKIHGLRNGIGFIGKLQRLFDWTQGCIALTNTEIKELFDNVPIGTKIEINK